MDLKEIEGDLCDLWNKYRTPPMPKARPSRSLTAKRMKNLKRRWVNEGWDDLEVWEKVFKYMSTTGWYFGVNNSGWFATFSWVFLPGRVDDLSERSEGVILDDDATDSVADAIDAALGQRSYNEVG